MSKFRDKAWEQYEVARYLLKTTFPAVEDPKLLLTVLSNLHTSLNEAMSHLIGPTLTFREKLFYLQKKGFPTEFIQELHEIMELHQKSPIEFSRHGQFVICSNNYSLRYLTPQKISEFLTQTKTILEQIDQFLTENNK